MPRQSATRKNKATPKKATGGRLPSFYTAVYAVVAEIPTGHVTTYGHIATWLGSPRAARAVGYALAAVPSGDLPWQRVVNREGGISVGGAVWRPDEQRRRLRAEGIRFGRDGLLSLARHRFEPSAAQLRRWGRLATKLMAGRERPSR